jgi:hypothetical protein
MISPEHIAELKRRLPLPRYFMAMGYAPRPKGKYFVMHCPFSIEYGRPRFRIYLDFFECRGCRKRGDLLEAHQELEGMRREQAYEDLCSIAGFNNSRSVALIPGAPVDITTLREIRRSR